MLTLAVNELATNALKYGARRRRCRRHFVVVSGKQPPTFAFLWRERGGPPVVAPTRQGFGSRVIKDFMANDFGGTVRLSYPADGVQCELTSPLANLPA